jgi:hypothetical protein
VSIVGGGACGVAVFFGIAVFSWPVAHSSSKFVDAYFALWLAMPPVVAFLVGRGIYSVLSRDPRQKTRARP